MGRRKMSGDDEVVPEQATTFELVRRFGPPVILVVAALLFVVQNTEATRFDFLWFEFEWPLWVMLVVFAAVGAVGVLVPRPAAPQSQGRLTGDGSRGGPPAHVERR